MFHAVAIGKGNKTTAHSTHDTLDDAASTLLGVLHGNDGFTHNAIGIVSDTGTVWSLNEAIGQGVSVTDPALDTQLRKAAGVVL